MSSSNNTTRTNRANRSAQIKDNFSVFWNSSNERILRSWQEVECFREITIQAAKESMALPEIIRKTKRLEQFAANYPPFIDSGQLLAGSRRFGPFHRPQSISESEFNALRINGNHGHIILDYGGVLRDGIPARLALVQQLLGQGDARQQLNRNCYARALQAFLLYIKRHAETAEKITACENTPERKDELTQIASNCYHLLVDKPQTFPQALQLVWFIHTFAYAEGLAAAFSFGRLDQYLWPYLRDDLAAQRLTVEDAKDWLACFWLKCSEGCESQNLTVGGVDAEGKLAENLLTMLCLEVAAELRLHQPSLSVRVCPQTSTAFWTAALKISAQGDGQPSYVNDTVTIDGLCRMGVPLRRARDWAIVGCFEPSTQGDCGSFSVGASWNLIHEFRQFFDAENDYPDFAAYYAGWGKYLREVFPQWHTEWEKRWAAMINGISPFESACLGGCIESGLTVEEGGAHYPFFGINILGFGTVVDSLLSVQRLVYQEKKLTLKALRKTVRDNYPDQSVYCYCRNLPERYGSAHATGNQLADKFSHDLGVMFSDIRVGGIARLNPGLFLFGSDVMRVDLPATPDGRRLGESCSYGAGPFAFGGTHAPTQVLTAAAQVKQNLFTGGTPLMLAFSRNDLANASGQAAIRGLLENYFRQGGFQVQFNVVSAEEMRQAQASPTQHSQLMVRVSGYSAKFTAIAPRWQDMLIVRTEQGL